MNYNNCIIGIILIAIPLILIIFCYRDYIDRRINGNKEHFFGGLSEWITGSPSPNLPISSGSINSENLNTLEKKINDNMNISNKFPPTELNGNTDDFKDSDNSEILQSIGSKPYSSVEKPIISKATVPATVQATVPSTVPSSATMPSTVPSSVPSSSTVPLSQPTPKVDMKSLLGKCQFFNDKCPDKYHQLGNFSIEGVGSNSILTCGDVQNTKPAQAIAQIKNNSIYEIHITDPGHGFLPTSPPKISIEGGKGHGATAEAIIDDDGFLKIVKIINPGYNYTETPNVLISAPYMNSSCHLCCKDEQLSL